MNKSILLPIATVLFVMIGNIFVYAQRVTVTLAGNGSTGYSGDGGSSKLATVSQPKAICIDGVGNIFFSDTGNGVIRRISAKDGVVSTIGGGGSSFADGVPATTARIIPNYMCVSLSGDLYFTTSGRIKKIDAATRLISTIAGTGMSGYSGDGGPAIFATLNNPQGICIDAASNIYIADMNNNCIRKIDGMSGNVNTIAGNGTPGFTGDGGPAISGLLSGPRCVCVSPAGDVFFSDQYLGDFSVIRKIAASTGILSKIAGASSGYTSGVHLMDAKLGPITGLCFSTLSGNVFCNEISCSCRKLDFIKDTLYLVGGNYTIEGYSDDTTAEFANMDKPYGLCVDGNEDVIIADNANQRLRKIIQLNHTPSFAYGHGQLIDPVVGTPYPLDWLMWVTDIDSGQTLSWAIVTPPTFGKVVGFPTATYSVGDASTTKPAGLSYSTLSTYAGSDFFRVSVTDNSGLADTINVYVGASDASALDANNSTTVRSTIDVFPNPATSILNIKWTYLKTNNANIVITDVANRVYYATSLMNNGGGSTQVDVSKLPAGVYLVRINDSEMSKFVKG